MSRGPTDTNLYYDPLGRLWKSVTASAVTRFLYDGSGELIREYDNAGTTLRSYVHGPATDEVLVDYQDSPSWVRRFPHADRLGSVVALSDNSGNAVGINKYDEYGIPQGVVTGRFGYTGQAWLPEIGLSYYKARIYSGPLGRFMQTDLIGMADSPNLYQYALSDPINTTDPTGLQCDADTWVCGRRTGGGFIGDVAGSLELGGFTTGYEPPEPRDDSIYVVAPHIRRNVTGLWSDFIKGIHPAICSSMANTNGIAHFGISGNLSLKFTNSIHLWGSGTVGVAMDGKWNFGIYRTGGVGPTTAGTSFNLGPSFGANNGRQIRDMEGIFTQFSGQYGDATATYYRGLGHDRMPVSGAELTFGPGAGSSGSAGVTNTAIDSFNLKSLIGC